MTSRMEVLLVYLSLFNFNCRKKQMRAYFIVLDVIGHAKYISDKLTSKNNQNLKYQKVIMSTHSSFLSEAEDELSVEFK